MDLAALKTKILGLDKDKLQRWQSDKKTSVAVDSTREQRINGHDHPVDAYTMIGQVRLDSLHKMLEDIKDRNIPGDLIECGVWRGGVCMFMAAFCHHYGLNKKIYVADSFRGLPEPSMAQDANHQDHMHAHLRISLADVKKGFRDMNIPMDNVVFVPGWFKDTLPNLPNAWAIIRADGDMYESTRNILDNLEPNLVNGGYMIIDDFGACGATCAVAVNEYRTEQGITDDLFTVDWTCKAWQKGAGNSDL